MKNYIINAIFTVVIVLFGRLNAYSQGAFTNLDFEHPVLPLNPVNSQVPAEDAIPGWVPNTSVLYNTVSLGAPAVSLQGPGSLEPILQGNYSVLIQGSSGGAPGSADIAQTGQVPVGALSIDLLVSTFSGPPQVTFDGTGIPLLELGANANYITLGGDISAFAGQTGELRFTVLPNSGETLLDDIQFSPTAVPEPAAWALLAAGGALMGMARWSSRFRLRQGDGGGQERPVGAPGLQQHG